MNTRHDELLERSPLSEAGTLKVSVVIGNPKPHSRTRTVAEALVPALLEAGSYDVEVIELADLAGELFEWGSEKVTAAKTSVASSDLVIFATPTYKASYTGLLKAFLDQYGTDGLKGVVAIPVFTGGDLTHSLAPQTTLAPLLLELGAAIPGRGLYFVIDNLPELDSFIAQAAADYAAVFASLSTVTGSVRRAPVSTP
ncbi:NADPH-dependent FMN reductase [Nocardia sp. 348MFTsu5.1]|uniref:NADPH-dependent FMN reductase n=1 Tax=Nocardia sp. 348MFTsu5.1 TaxID=1172185 RepID=UPI0012DCB999|nr:NAD(P)H-dependent oxidoreductase [Nocardia sp. 348MFTsu5.1]